MTVLRSTSIVVGVTAFVVGLVGGPAWACSIPVFRYALERWPAAPYEAVVFHKGPLGAEDKALLETLKKAALDGDGTANLVVHAADVAGKLEKEAAALWQREGAAETPWLVLLYPFELRVESNAWSGRPTKEVVAALLDSPARREIARRLAAGDCAVWLLVESGDKAKDAAAAKLLREELKKLDTVLELPPADAFGEEPPEPSPAPDAPPAAKQELKVAFSSLRVSRGDKAERAFLDLLLGVDPELKKEQEPMAFAIFGQGRALPCLIGKGINADNIGEICAFVIGPCSCQVKAMNPGWDLLLTTDWAAVIEGRPVTEQEAPALAGSVPAPLPKETAAPVPVPATPPAAAPPASAGSPLLRNLILAVAAGLLILAIGSFILLRKGGTSG